MSTESSRLREVLIERGKVIAIREQSVGTLMIYLKRPITGTVFPRELMVSWILISVGSASDFEKYAGIHFYMPAHGDLMREQECYLDMDEVNEFIDGIDFVASTRDTLCESVLERRDLYYASRENIRIGVYKRAEETSTIPYLALVTGGDIHFFTTAESKASDQSSALSALTGDEFAPIRSLVANALSQLKEIGK